MYRKQYYNMMLNCYNYTDLTCVIDGLIQTRHIVITPFHYVLSVIFPLHLKQQATHLDPTPDHQGRAILAEVVSQTPVYLMAEQILLMLI